MDRYVNALDKLCFIMRNACAQKRIHISLEVFQRDELEGTKSVYELTASRNFGV